MGVRFTKGATVVAFTRDPEWPTQLEHRRSQVLGETAGAVAYVYDRGVKIDVHRLRWSVMDQADHDALLAFWDLVKGRLDTWTYTDSSGTNHTVRFAMESLAFDRRSPSAWQLDVELREEL